MQTKGELKRFCVAVGNIFLLLPASRGRGGGWEDVRMWVHTWSLSQLSLGKGGFTPRTSRQVITGSHRKKNNHLHSHSLLRPNWNSLFSSRSGLIELQQWRQSTRREHANSTLKGRLTEWSNLQPSNHCFTVSAQLPIRICHISPSNI